MAKSSENIANISFKFHSYEEKPMHSGYYLAIYNISSNQDMYMSIYYNAETKKWNDRIGNGDYSINVYAWAEETEDIYNALRTPVIGDIANV